MSDRSGTVVEAISGQAGGTARFELAAVFDLVDPVTGPAFAEDHPVIEDEAGLEALVGYLGAGVPVLMTPTLMDDVVDPSRGAVVPMNFRTDGSWIWTDTVTYYLEEYGLAPEPGLLAHLRERGSFDWTPDQETVERAAAFILTPPETADDEPVWRAG
ncbi:hypothetical protein ABH930_000247 [Kitasatospora sp. GAS204A]|uniref:hypothetical protein n=1 Tax=unclassified Kitasatospora TaxID=2633591 RepID=UPI0024749DE4|nr:hypothetical protein [Kitasatospora sp. GAS204B]MDH6116828.1 hypothetical protein [Kitasatospora sp. GAS204B]